MHTEQLIWPQPGQKRSRTWVWRQQESGSPEDNLPQEFEATSGPQSPGGQSRKLRWKVLTLHKAEHESSVFKRTQSLGERLPLSRKKAYHI